MPTMFTASRTDGVMPLAIWFSAIKDKTIGRSATPNITGLMVDDASSNTPDGSGTVYYRDNGGTKEIAWQAPSDTQGSWTAVTGTGSYKIPSNNTAYWVEVRVVIASLPGAPAQDAITIGTFDPSVVQPRGATQPSAITGVSIFAVASSTEVGIGTLSYIAASKSLTWQAPGDNGPGTAVSFTADNIVRLSSADGSWIEVAVDYSLFPVTNQSETISITDGGTTANFASYRYIWGFGDTEENWAYGLANSSKNRDEGPVACHVFETAGTKTVTLTIYDGDNNATVYTQAITVSAGTWTTYYVSSSHPAKNDSNPGTDPELPLATFEAAVEKRGANVQILFKRGDTWTVSTESGFSVNVVGPCMFGAYGTGNRPLIIRSDQNSAAIFKIDNTTDLRIVDLSGSADSVNVAGLGFVGGLAEIVQFLCLRCNMAGGQTAFGYSHYNTNNLRQIGFIECTTDQTTHPSQYAGYGGGDQVAFMGCNLGPTDGTHVLRIYNLRRGVIAHNNIHDPGNTRLALKLHSEFAVWLRMTQYSIIHDNWFVGSRDAVAIAPQDFGSNEMLSDIIFERNKISSTTVAGREPAQIFLLIQARNVTVRNNIIEGTFGSSYFHCCSIDNQAITNPPLLTQIIGNDMVTAGVNQHSEYYGTEISTTAARTVVANNAMYCADQSVEIYYVSGPNGGGGGPRCDVANYKSKVDPGFVDPASSNWRITQATTALLDQGVPTTLLYEDAINQSRPDGDFSNLLTRNLDIGAYEYIVSSTPSVTTASPSSITMTSAVAGGNVTSDGNSAITARGCCWNTSGSPTTANSKTTDGVGTGVFTSSLTGLSPSTTYHVRAYATNGEGTSYGDEKTFTTNAVPISTRPIIIKPPFYTEPFIYSTPSPDWAAVGGNISLTNERFAIVTAPGEIKYVGTPLNQISGQTTPDIAFTLYFYSQPDTHIELRTRRLDDENYIAVEFDQINRYFRLIKVISNEVTELDVFPHSLRPSNVGLNHLFRGYKKNAIALWMYGGNLYGFLNGALFLQATDVTFNDQFGFSIYSTAVGQKIEKLYAAQLFPQPPENPNVPDFWSYYRHVLQYLVDPEVKTWETLKKAFEAYDLFRNKFYNDATWTMLGFPLYRPTTEMWFTESGISE